MSNPDVSRSGHWRRTHTWLARGHSVVARGHSVVASSAEFIHCKGRFNCGPLTAGGQMRRAVLATLRCWIMQVVVPGWRLRAVGW